VSLLDVHEVWAWVVVGGNGLAGLWATAAHWVVVLRRRSLWWFTAFAQLSVFLQVILGVLLMTNQGREAPQLHTFYGFVAIIAIAIIYSYRQQVAPWRFLLYGLGSLFIMGLALRAIIVGIPA
jgi:hypothetical protein